jgi:uncharacterized protein involved in outer membrane biogenesis
MKRWHKIALWTGIGVVVLIAGAATWLWTADLGVFKPQIERLVSDATGRDLRIGGLSIDLGDRSTVIAEDIRFQNADWAAENDMVGLDRIEVQVDLWSLFKTPIVVHLLDIDGAVARLAVPEDGRPNWEMAVDETSPEPPAPADEAGLDILIGEIFVDDARIIFDSPERTGPIDLRIDSLQQRHRDDDILELAISGSIGERSVSVEGEVGTWQNLRVGENVRYSLTGAVDLFSFESSGVIDSLADPRRPALTFSATGPDINDVFAIAGVDANGEGDISLTGSLAAAGTGPLELSVEGNAGQLDINAAGTFSDLRDLENVELQLQASGPDLSRILRLFGIHSIQEAPFMIDVDAERRGSRLIIERSRMEFAAAEFNATAEIPNFPDVDDADIELSIEGPDIGRFRKVLNLPGAATGAFSLVADVKTSDDGVELAKLRVETSLGTVEASGTLGEEPGLIGTELRFDLQSPSLAQLAGSYGLPRLPDEPVEISGSAVLESEGVRTQGPLVIQVANITATADGLLRAVSGLYGSRLDYGLQGPDLAKLIGAFADSAMVPARPYRFNGTLDIREEGFEFGRIAGQLGRMEIIASGLLRPVSGITGSRFEFSVDGPEIGEIISPAFDVDIRPGPYSLSGAVGFAAPAIEFEDLRLNHEVGQVELDLQIGLEEQRFGFRVDAEGRDLRAVLSRIEGIEAEASPFSVTGRGELYNQRLTLDDLDIVLGDATLDASGDLDFAENAGSTHFRFDLDIPNLARIGTFHGYRMRPQALNLVATVEGGGGVLSVDKAAARLDDSTVEGAFRYEVGEVPMLDVRIKSDSLLLVSPLEQRERAYDPEPKFDDGRIIPDIPVPLHALSALNLSVDVAIADMIREEQHFRNVELQMGINDGALEVSRLGFEAPSGRLDARARLSPSGETAVIDLEIVAEDLNLGLRQAAANSDRTRDAQVNLHSTGANLRELAANASGIILLDTRGGEFINNRFLQALYGDMLEEILSVVNPFYKADPVTRFECVILPVQISEGQLTSAPSVLVQTDKVRIVAEASIDLETEKLDMTFRTTPRRGVIISAGEILNPFVKVVGTLAAPRLAIDEEGMLITGGAAVATAGLSILARAAWDRVSRSSDPCGDMSKQAVDALGNQFANFSGEPIN